MPAMTPEQIIPSQEFLASILGPPSGEPSGPPGGQSGGPPPFLEKMYNPFRTCKGEGLHCARGIFDEMSSSNYKQVSFYFNV